MAPRGGFQALPALVGDRELVAVAELRRLELLGRWLILAGPSPEGCPNVVVEVLAAAQARMAELLFGRIDAEYWAEERWRHEFFHC